MSFAVKFLFTVQDMIIQLLINFQPSIHCTSLGLPLSCFYPDVLTRSGDCWHRHSLCAGACDVSESTQQAKAFKQRYDFGQVSKAETFEQFISPLRRSP